MKTIQSEAKQIAKVIAKKYKPEKIILFGSVARGKTHKDSDIDLLIIKNSKKKRHLRTRDVFEAVDSIERNYDLDVHVYTPFELQKRVTLGDFFIKRVLNEGKVLYGQL